MRFGLHLIKNYSFPPFGGEQVGTGGMDSKVNAATWALDRGVSVVICNGAQDKAIKAIIAGRKVGTFFTENAAGGPTPVDTLAENGKKFN